MFLETGTKGASWSYVMTKAADMLAEMARRPHPVTPVVGSSDLLISRGRTVPVCQLTVYLLALRMRVPIGWPEDIRGVVICDIEGGYRLQWL